MALKDSCSDIWIRDIMNKSNIGNSKKMSGMTFLLLDKLFIRHIIMQEQWQSNWICKEVDKFSIFEDMVDIYYC